MITFCPNWKETAAKTGMMRIIYSKRSVSIRKCFAKDINSKPFGCIRALMGIAGIRECNRMCHGFRTLLLVLLLLSPLALAHFKSVKIGYYDGVIQLEE